ncbi:MAG: hypothetical protein HZA34_00205 [Candidatus Pacebacteria bacterium]|nr:hypothetical protein [Candidatus Paceibacterota bacterium]
MLSLSHAATGAFLAAKLQNPLLYIPIILASHYLEDYILHWDVGTGLSNGTRKREHAFMLEVIDLGLTAVLVFAMYPTTPWTITQHVFAGQWTSLAPYIGAFFALVPDFIEAPRNFFHWNPWFLKPLNAFHHAIHHSTPNMLLGLTPQLILLAGLWFFR